MIELRKTAEFDRWLLRLRDLNGLARIKNRIDLLEHGILGDHKYLGTGLFELRIHFGPGYRIYAMRRGSTVILLLAGGDKDSQEKDIRSAFRLARKT